VARHSDRALILRSRGWVDRPQSVSACTQGERGASVDDRDASQICRHMGLRHVARRRLRRAELSEQFRPGETGFAIEASSERRPHRLLCSAGCYLNEVPAGLLWESVMKTTPSCDHVGGRFGMVHHRWWGRKFCDGKCKDA